MMNGYGMDGGGWIWMVLVWAGLLGVIAFAITRLVGGGERSGAGAPDARAELRSLNSNSRPCGRLRAAGRSRG